MKDEVWGRPNELDMIMFKRKRRDICLALCGQEDHPLVIWKRGYETADPIGVGNISYVQAPNDDNLPAHATVVLNEKRIEKTWFFDPRYDRTEIVCWLEP